MMPLPAAIHLSLMSPYFLGRRVLMRASEKGPVLHIVVGLPGPF